MSVRVWLLGYWPQDDHKIAAFQFHAGGFAGLNVLLYIEKTNCSNALRKNGNIRKVKTFAFVSKGVHRSCEIDCFVADRYGYTFLPPDSDSSR